MTLNTTKATIGITMECLEKEDLTQDQFQIFREALNDFTKAYTDEIYDKFKDRWNEKRNKKIEQNRKYRERKTRLCYELAKTIKPGHWIQVSATKDRGIRLVEFVDFEKEILVCRQYKRYYGRRFWQPCRITEHMFKKVEAIMNPRLELGHTNPISFDIRKKWNV